ncbi:MAG: ComEA family DNA-binding protein [Candidatus Methylomirabilota bacterium]
MTLPSGPPSGIETHGIRDAHALAVLLLAAVLGVGTALPLLGPEGSDFPQPRVPEQTAQAGVQGPEPSAGASPTRSPSSRVSPLNLNTADAEALQTLPGVGPALAERIVAYRWEHGPFQAVEDLLQVPGIGPRRWERIRPIVRVAEVP